MRRNKWSATIALVTLLLSGGSLADLNKSRVVPKPEDPKRCERSACDCHLSDSSESYQKKP